MKIKEFREDLKTSSEEERKDRLNTLYIFLTEQKNPSTLFPNEIYSFDYKTALKLLEDYGVHIEKKKKHKSKKQEPTPKQPFYITDRPNSELKKRSFDIEEGILERLLKFLEDNKKSFSNQGYALSQILEKGLDYYS